MSTSMFSWRRIRPVVVVSLAALILGTPAARATTVVKMTFSEVADAAEVIAIGTVSAIQQTWDAELEMPFTAVTFSDLEILKGEVGSEELTLRFLGGPAPDGLTLVVTGMPKFAVGDRAVVFSMANGVQACPLVGWWQGLYRVLFDPGRDAFTVADHVGRDVVAFTGGFGRRVARLSSDLEASAADALTLDDFRTLIRNEVR